MSGRKVPRFALAGLLAAAFGTPAVALNPLPEAPMPRAKAKNQLRLELSFGARNGLNVDVRRNAVAVMPEPVKPVAPMAAPTAHTFSTPVGVPGAQIAVPALGPVPLQFDFVMPKPSIDNLRLYNFSAGLFEDTPFVEPAKPACLAGGFGSFRATAAPQIVAPQRQLFTFGDSARIQLVGASDVLTPAQVCPPCPFPRIEPNPLLGTWHRDANVVAITATFSRDEMKLCLTQRDGAVAVTVTVTAHYTLTKDGLVYGAITSADVDVNHNGKVSDDIGMEFAELSLTLQELADRPFSFRTKATSAGLMVSQLKFASSEGLSRRELGLFGGLYKSAKEGKVSEAKPLKTVGAAGIRDCALPAAFEGAVVAPPGARIGIDFNAVPTIGHPVEPGTMVVVPAPFVAPPACPAPCPTRSAPPVSNDAMKSMASEAFGQMLWSAGGASQMTLPSPRYLQHYPEYFAPDPAFPLPRELASQECPATTVRASAAAAKPGVVGTWYRDIGSKRCVVKIEADHLTMTASEAYELNGKIATAHLTLTADYHFSRDGQTVVGLVTSVDAKIDGEAHPGEAGHMMEQVGELQKMLEEKPYAMTVRVYGDTLVIGNVRMQSVGDLTEIEPAAYIGGRYTSVGDKPLPQLKAEKVRGPQPVPVYVPAASVPPASAPAWQPGPAPVQSYGYPSAPTGERLPPQAVPVPSSAPCPANCVEPAPRVLAPTPPTMIMPQPTAPPGDSRTDSIRQLYKEWRRFWYNDQPSHLTPERIHGGIY